MGQPDQVEANDKSEFERIAVVPGFLRPTIDIPKMKTQKKTKRNEKQNMRNWCINVGGLEGLWRLLHVVDDLLPPDRPDIVCAQETACNHSQWLVVKAFMQQRGYDGYHSGAREVGSLKKRKEAHRGVITFVDQSLSARWLGEFSWAGGQYHAISMNDILYVNYYVAPSEEEKASQMTSLEEFLVGLDWQGPWLFMGDWNEPYADGWIGTLSCLFGGDQADMSSFAATRWEGNRVIDYPVSNFGTIAVNKREEKISDHIILDFSFMVGAAQSRSSMQKRFVRVDCFTRPLWLTPQKWQQTFDKAVMICASENWQEAISFNEKSHDWDSIQEDEVLEQNKAVDYEWSLACAMLSLAFRTAYVLAIGLIDADYGNLEEMKRVTHLANHRWIKGSQVKIVDRKMPKKAEKTGMEQRKRWKRMGRLAELHRRLQRGQLDQETDAIAFKLYGTDACYIDLAMVEAERKQVEKYNDKCQQKAKSNAIKDWKQRMRNDITARAGWLNKKGSTKPVAVVGQNATSTNKQEALAELRSYWGSILQGNGFSSMERNQRAMELANCLFDNDIKENAIEGRPSLDHFRSCLKTVKGCAGADGWSKEELYVIAGNSHVSAMIWNTMMRWEAMECIPTAVKHCKMVCVPKKDEYSLPPSAFRPIGILSSWWRGWSTTWISDKRITSWTKSTFPVEVAGGIAGSCGPDALAAVIGHELQRLGFGITLDFRHAFDSIDLEMMEQVMQCVLPHHCARWSGLLFSMWTGMSRWVVYDSSVHHSCITSSFGLPQGDPASPLVMNLLMLGMKKTIDQKLAEGGSRFLHAIYMDDRTIVADNYETIKKAKQCWSDISDHFRLWENPDKAQEVIAKKNGSCFEVLGTLIGQATKQQREQSKLRKRFDKTMNAYKKISMMPVNMNSKMGDMGVFGKAALAYGWVDLFPPKDWTNHQEANMWKNLARTHFANKHLKNVISGATTSFRMAVLMRNLRLIAKRNDILMKAGIQITPCQLDKQVDENLKALNWRFEEGRYRHGLFLHGFNFEEILNDKLWKDAEHYVRESYRQVQYLLFIQSDRHELQDLHEEGYVPKRRQLVVDWMKTDSLAQMVAIGAIQSPLLKWKLRGISSKCPRCNEENPEWNHFWPCWAGIEAPQDTMMRRFCWARNRTEFLLCNKVVEGIRAMMC